MTQENSEILKVLDEMKKGQSQDNAQKLTQLLEKSVLYVPAVMPQNTDPAILKQMAESNGKPLPIPEGAKPQPFILENQNKKKFFPIFTSREEIEKGKNLPKYPIILNMPFKACMEFITHTDNVEAAVINPYSQNVVMNVHKNDKKNVKLTEPQFHAVIRQQLESRILPQKIFREGSVFLDDLCSRQGECILELLSEPYSKTNNCPYLAEDYDFMTLNINDDLRLTRIVMPVKKQYPDTAVSVFIAYNPQTDTSKYYAIVKGRNNEANKLYQVMSDGKVENHGEAPTDGNELQSIIDLASA